MLGEKTFNAIGAAVAGMLTDYGDDLNVAYGNAERKSVENCFEFRERESKRRSDPDCARGSGGVVRRG